MRSCRLVVTLVCTALPEHDYTRGKASSSTADPISHDAAIELACVALMLFHRLHPDQEIHVYGAAPRGLDIPVTFHGRLTTAELNDLYGRTIAGLAMSFTNITLVAEEMLAAGSIPGRDGRQQFHRSARRPCGRSRCRRRR